MSVTERYTKIETLLRVRRSLSFREMQDMLEVSRATLYRDIAYLRDRLGVPIELEPESKRYFLNLDSGSFELPGLWLNAEEIRALLAMQKLIGEVDASGLLHLYLEPIQRRLATLLGQDNHAAEEVAARIRIIAAAPRRCLAASFQLIASTLLARRQIAIEYQARSSAELSRRVVSPLRLIHYRDNWYLLAFCHRRQALRSFSVDAIQSAQALDQAAVEVCQDDLDAYLQGGYGIFGGAQIRWAILRFSSLRARWVASETWHPAQEGAYLADGRFQLRLPYSQDPELIMDILKYGQDCEVIEPMELREKVIGQLQKSLAGYGLVSSRETSRS